MRGGRGRPSGGRQCPTREWPPLGPPLAGPGPLPATCRPQLDCNTLLLARQQGRSPASAHTQLRGRPMRGCTQKAGCPGLQRCARPAAVSHAASLSHATSAAHGAAMSHTAAASPPQLGEHVAPKGQHADQPGCSAACLVPSTCLQVPQRLQQQVPEGCHCSNAHTGAGRAAGRRSVPDAGVQLLADEGAFQERPQPLERLCSVRCEGD